MTRGQQQTFLHEKLEGEEAGWVGDIFLFCGEQSRTGWPL